MGKKALPLLTGGLNELTRPDLIDNTQLQISNNYEVIGDGTLKLRKAEETFSSALNTKLSELFAEVIVMSEPFYPQKMIDVHVDAVSYPPVDEYILLFFGKTEDGLYELHSLFRYTDENGLEQWDNSVVWDADYGGALNNLNDLLVAAGLYLNEDSLIKFTFGQNKVIITDNVNNTFFIELDLDGVLRAGVLGISPPTNKAEITQMETWDADLWEGNNEEQSVGSPGLFQCTYSVVTKYNEESNPAPLSETLDMQFFELDDDSMDTRWIDMVHIKNLSIPAVSESVLESLEKFRLYIRVIRYSDGLGAVDLDFSEEFDILNKVDDNGNILTSGETGNDYILTIPPDAGNNVSYENDLAPIAKTSAEITGVTMLGNVKTKLSFPYNFRYFHRITVNNTDSKSYVDAIVKIRLWGEGEAVIGQGTSIENFTVEDFVNEERNITNTNNIRIFNNDLTTPINCLYNPADYEDDAKLDLYIKIPLLPSVSQHYIYLCWNSSEDTDYAGVPDIYQEFEYGKVFNAGVDPDESQNMFHTLRVKSGDLIVDNFEAIYESNGNKADTSLEIENPSDQYINSIDSADDFVIPNIPTLSVGSKAIQFTSEVGALNYDFNSTQNIPDEGTTYVRLNHTHDDCPRPGSPVDDGFGNVKSVVTFVSDDPTDTFLMFSLATSSIFEGEPGHYVLHVMGPELEDEFNVVYYGPFKHDDDTYVDITQKLKGFLAFSWKKDEESRLAAHLYYYDDGNDQNKYRYATANLKQSSLDSHSGFSDSWVNNTWLNAYLGPPIDGDDVLTIRQALDELNVLGQTKLGVGAYYAPSADNTGPWYDYYDDEDGDGFHTGADGFQWGKYDDWVYEPNFFLDPDKATHRNMFINMANYQPKYSNYLGYEHIYGTHNNNILFSKTEEAILKERKTMIKWSDINALNFPDLNFKLLREPIIAIIPAPSFLQFEYANTFLIFTRNTINRFILKGSAEGWAGSVSSLIEEKTQYGLMAEKSLVRVGDAIFWLSEVGVVMWDSKGMRLISKNIVNVPLKDNSIAYYNSLRNQYIIQSAIETEEGIIPGDEEGGGEGEEEEETGINTIPGWNFGSNIEVRYFGDTGEEIHEEVNGWGQIFTILGVSPEIGYSNFILTNLGLPPPSSNFNPDNPTTIWELIVKSNPTINIWNMVLLDGVPVGTEHYFDILTPNGYNNPMNQNPDPALPTLSFDFPDMLWNLNYNWIQTFIDASECADGTWFTFGDPDGTSGIPNPTGPFYCNLSHGIGLSNISIVQNGFWKFPGLPYLGASFVRAVHIGDTGERGRETPYRQTAQSYVYDIGRAIWTKFIDLEKINSSSILTGGNQFNNVNLLLNSSNEVYKYPGEGSVNSGTIKTKKLYFEKGVIRRVNLEHHSGTNNVSLTTNLEKYNADGEITGKSNTIQAIKNKKWRGIPLGSNRGRALTLEVNNADNVGTIGYDLKVEE